MQKIISIDHTDTPFSYEGIVLKSKMASFSDKLMMAFVSSLNMESIANIGKGIAASMRTDLIGEYPSLVLRVEKYGSVGAKIAVDNGWVEKPLQTPDIQRVQE